MILRCTAKVLTLVKPASLAEAPPSDDDWYANTFPIRRRKCLLLTHAETLFSVVVPNVVVSRLRPPGPLVVDHVKAAVQREQLPPDVFGDLDASDVYPARTADRRVLGVMTDHRYVVELATDQRGGLGEENIDGLHHRLHRHITLSKGTAYPIDLVRSKLDSS